MRLHELHHRDFASDNFAGVHPEVLAAMAEANGGHVHSYGDDPYTQRLRDVMRELFHDRVVIYPMVTGTGANVVALAGMTPRWGSVITPHSAHLHTDEGGAPERMAGLKLLTVPESDGKLSLDGLREAASSGPEVHFAQPSVVCVAQATELGTVYSVDHLRELVEYAHSRGLTVYLDGSRLANAAASLGVSLSEMTVATGVDVLTLGGTKNGCYDAELLVVLNPSAVSGLGYVQKMNAQLTSKTRFASAQLLALYGTDLWLASAGHANAMAARLAQGLSQIPGVGLVQEVQANAVFATMPQRLIDQLRTQWAFYDWRDGVVRLMCAWDTQISDVDAFLTTARSI